MKFVTLCDLSSGSSFLFLNGGALPIHRPGIVSLFLITMDISTDGTAFEGTAALLRAESSGDHDADDNDGRGDAHRGSVCLDDIPFAAAHEMRLRDGVDDLCTRRANGVA